MSHISTHSHTFFGATLQLRTQSKEIIKTGYCLHMHNTMTKLNQGDNKMYTVVLKTPFLFVYRRFYSFPLLGYPGTDFYLHMRL